MKGDRIEHAMFGALVADAVSMPVHWYYDTNALDRDYPNLSNYQGPKKIHPDSILWRSKYVPRNKEADILHDQAQYWGQRGVHYHQFLNAGENTLNFILGIQLYRSVVLNESYTPDRWLKTYIDCMHNPNWHRDTYIEEYHRAFFDRLAQGIAAEKCGIEDIHIGGLTPVAFLLAGLNALGDRSLEEDLPLVISHLALTHHGQAIASTAEVFVKILHAIASGMLLRDAIELYCSRYVNRAALDTWSQVGDREVVGRHLTSACYLPESFTASLYLAWKYHEDFSAGVLANARCGGDNSHRGAVVGALLGAANDIPKYWFKDLKAIGLLQGDNSQVTN